MVWKTHAGVFGQSRICAHRLFCRSLLLLFCCCCGSYFHFYLSSVCCFLVQEEEEDGGLPDCFYYFFSLLSFLLLLSIAICLHVSYLSLSCTFIPLLLLFLLLSLLPPFYLFPSTNQPTRWPTSFPTYLPIQSEPMHST